MKTDFELVMEEIGRRTGPLLRDARALTANMTKGAVATFEKLQRTMATPKALSGVCALSALMMKADNKVDGEEISAAVRGIKAMPFFLDHSESAVLATLKVELDKITDTKDPMQRFTVVTYAKDRLPTREERILTLEVVGRIAAADGNFDDDEREIAMFLIRELEITHEDVALVRSLPAAGTTPRALPAPAAKPVPAAPAPSVGPAPKGAWS